MLFNLVVNKYLIVYVLFRARQINTVLTREVHEPVNKDLHFVFAESRRTLQEFCAPVFINHKRTLSFEYRLCLFESITSLNPVKRKQDVNKLILLQRPRFLLLCYVNDFSLFN